MTDQTRITSSTPICDKEWRWVSRNRDDFKAVPLDVALNLELKAADMREQLAKAREEAIEECARVCDRFAERDMHPAECAAAIRAIKQKGESNG